jgi:RNA polymerase sigma factor (sigma-70 family)
LVAVPSIGRATEVTPRRAAPEADATRELYERYARQIYTYCLHQLGNREEAEDATQSTFLNAFRGYKRGVDPEFESAWVYKIAQNVCLTRQRSSSRRRKVETPGDLDAMQDYVPAHQADSDELIRLPEALDAMPEQQRRALLLREWQGLSYKEIGEELDLSQAAVETLLFRARRSLAAGLSEEPVKKASGMAKRLGMGDLGSVLSIVKSLVLTGGVKVATAVATVAATSVVAATPVARHAVENVVAPHPDKAPVHHVTARPASAGGAAAVGAPASLVPAQPAAAGASSAPLTTAAAKTRRHTVALHARAGAIGGSGVVVGHAPRTPDPSPTVAAPTVVTPTVDTPAPVTDPPAPTHLDAPAPQPAVTQPTTDKPKTDAPAKNDSGSKNDTATPTTKKDDANASAGQGTTSNGTTPAATTPAATTSPSTPNATGDRNLAASKSDAKKNDDNSNNGNGKGNTKDAKSAAVPAPSSAPITSTPTVTTPATTTTATTPTVTTPATTTTTTTTAAPPAPAPPVAAPAATQQAQSDKGQGHKADGKSDNGGGNDGNGKKK